MNGPALCAVAALGGYFVAIYDAWMWVHSDRSLKSNSVHRRGMARTDWRRDPKIVRDIVGMAKADGFRLSTIVSARSVLLRYSKFLFARFGSAFTNAGWEEFAPYKSHLAKSGVSGTTVRSYVY